MNEELKTHSIESAINEAYDLGLLMGISSKEEYDKRLFRTTLRRIASAAIDVARNEQNNLINDLGYAIQRIDDHSPTTKNN